jgi:hypothetical protein
LAAPDPKSDGPLLAKEIDSGTTAMQTDHDTTETNLNRSSLPLMSLVQEHGSQLFPTGGLEVAVEEREESGSAARDNVVADRTQGMAAGSAGPSGMHVIGSTSSVMVPGGMSGVAVQSEVGCEPGSSLLETKQLEAKEFFFMSLSEGVSSMPVMQVANECSSRVILDDEMSSGSVSFEPLVSMHGPDANMQGVVMDAGMRSDMAGQEEMALGKMRHFCASILKKLAPPLDTS